MRVPFDADDFLDKHLTTFLDAKEFFDMTLGNIHSRKVAPKSEKYEDKQIPNFVGIFGVDDRGYVSMRNVVDNRTAEQIINDLMRKDQEQQTEINQLRNQCDILSKRIMILYKEFKRFGDSVELFD